MTTVDAAVEAAGPGGSQMAAAQSAGIDVLSAGAAILFKAYRRAVLPADGFVFWVRADDLTYGPLNTAPLNSVALNVGSVSTSVPTRQVTPSSLHHTTLNQQDEAESYSLQKLTLTCQEPVDFLTEIAPDQMWVAEWGPLRFAFSQRTGYYRQANTYHYRGDALYPPLSTQLVDFPEQLDGSLVVSNSLPIWLGLNSLQPIAELPPGLAAPWPLAPPFTLYPSYAVPDNIAPPYAAVHIGVDDTKPLTLGALHDATVSRYQHAIDQVRVTLYGVRNDAAMDFLDTVAKYTRWNPDVMGLMSTPTVRDDKRGQVEFGILAQKKVVEFKVNYWQLRMNDLARQLIRQVIVNYEFAPPVAA